MLLSRDDILKADDRDTLEIEVPEWGGTVSVRALSGTERDAFEASLMVERPAIGADGKRIPGQLEMHRSVLNIRAKLVVRSVVDADGKRLFKDTDAAVLGEKSGAVLDRLFDAAADLSGISDKQVEELANFSAPGQGDDSSSS